MHWNLEDAAKTGVSGTFRAVNSYIKKKKISNTQPTLQFKEEKNKLTPNLAEGKKLKIGTERNEIENYLKKWKVIKTKLVFERIRRIDKSLCRITKKKGKIQINAEMQEVTSKLMHRNKWRETT